MGVRLLGLAVGLSMFVAVGAAQAETATAAPVPTLAGSDFSLSAMRPTHAIVIRRARLDANARSSMPRELPEVREDYVRPIPGVDWRPAKGAVVKLRPAKLRFNLDF